ncbi:MAG: GNAT family N-acetyltransferase [Nostocoides sp.]
MSRRPVLVTAVESPTDEDFQQLWIASRVAQGGSAEASARYVAEGRLDAALSREGLYVFMAGRNGEPVGLVVLALRTFGLSETADVCIDSLFVVPGMRRHGVARQLLAATAAQAERLGSERIVSNVPAQDREVNRFFARLGFGASSTRRVTTSAALRRRVHEQTEVSVVEHVLRRRRASRALGGTWSHSA